jgi:hypothetical protein
MLAAYLSVWLSGVAAFADAGADAATAIVVAFLTLTGEASKRS